MRNLVQNLSSDFIFIYITLLPLALILGNFAINFFLYFLVLLVFIRIFYTQKWNIIHIKNNKIRIIFYFTWIYLVIVSIFIHEYSLKSITKSILFGLNFLFALGLSSYLFELNKKKLKIISVIFFSITIFIYFDLLYQFFNSEMKDIFGFEVTNIRNYNYFGKDLVLPIRLSGPFKNELVPGFYLSTIGCLSIFLLFSFIYPNRKKLLILFLLINFAFVILTGERSSVIINYLTLFLFILLSTRFSLKTILNIFYLSIILILSINFNPTTKERFSDLIFWTFDKWSMKEVSKDFENNGFTGKLNHKNIMDNVVKTPWMKHFSTSIEIIKANPLYGTGIRSFRYECKKYDENSCTTHPHHYILEILSETGIIFFLLLLTLIIFIVKESWKNKDKNYHFNLGILLIFLSYLFPLRPTGSFFSSWHGSFFWILLAFLLFSTKLNIKKNDQKIL